jgi:hypothetical protein
MSIIILLEALMVPFFLSLSDNTKEAIMQKLREGYGKRDTRAAIRHHFNERIRGFEAASSSSSSAYVVHRNQFVHSEDVYNVYKKTQESSYKKHNDQKNQSSFDCKIFSNNEVT